MPWDLAVTTEDRPGTGVDVGEVLTNAGIRVKGGCSISYGGRGNGHLLLDDAVAARRALEAAGVDVGPAREVMLVEIGDEGGALWDVMRRTAGAGVNIELLYVAFDGRLVLGVDDLDKAREAL